MKLRGGVKEHQHQQDGGRSSSGNWSGSSSTRASLECEATAPASMASLASPVAAATRLTRSTSNASLEFDSALSDCSQSVTSRSLATPRLAKSSAPIGRQWTVTVPQPPSGHQSTCSTSEGTITPEVPQHAGHSDVDASSLYSCDAEGYYTSFHIDSGLKTLKVTLTSTLFLFIYHMISLKNWSYELVIYYLVIRAHSSSISCNK